MGTGRCTKMSTAYEERTAIELAQENTRSRLELAVNKYSTAWAHKAQTTVWDQVDSGHHACRNTCRDGTELYSIVRIDTVLGLQ